jgi:hypothetical protein
LKFLSYRLRCRHGFYLAPNFIEIFENGTAFFTPQARAGHVGSLFKNQ